MPDNNGRLYLYSDTSKFATGNALYPIQNGPLRQISYASKLMTAAVQNYSLTKLELCRLAINITSFSYLLKRVDFDAMVGHLAITHIFHQLHLNHFVFVCI